MAQHIPDITTNDVYDTVDEFRLFTSNDFFQQENDNLLRCISCGNPDGSEDSYICEVYWQEENNINGYIHRFMFDNFDYFERKIFLLTIDCLVKSAKRFQDMLPLTTEQIQDRYCLCEQIDATPEKWCSDLYSFIEIYGKHRIPLTLRYWAEQQFFNLSIPVNPISWPVLTFESKRTIVIKRALAELTSMRSEMNSITRVPYRS